MEKHLESLEREFQGSPYWNLLGIRLKELKVGSVKTELVIQPSLMNVNGALHGGVYASILDSTMGLTSRSLGFEGAVTLQMQLQFLGSAKSGTIYAETNVVHQTRSTALIEGKLFDQDDNLIAHSTGTFKMINRS